MRLKIRGSHPIFKAGNKCLNACEWVGLTERNKAWSPPFSYCPVNRQCVIKKTLKEKKLTEMQALLKQLSNFVVIFVSLQRFGVTSKIKIMYNLFIVSWNERCKWLTFIKMVLFITITNFKFQLLRFWYKNTR